MNFGRIATIAALVAATAGTFTLGGDAAQKFTRPSSPRILPLEPSQWSDAQRELLGAAGRSGQAPFAYKTCLRNLELCRNWLAFSRYIEGTSSSLPARDREMLILRTAWLCHDDYVWTPHARAAQRAGLTDQEIQGITKGPQATGWSAFEISLLRAVDELHANHFIEDETWKALTEHYNERQFLDLIFLVGGYEMVAGFTNSVGIQLEAGYAGLPKSP
jgi:4-carboxymuconolactone decarboxylase